MTGREPFLRAIAERPDDPLPGRIFADWLDEHGFPGEAAYWRGARAVPPELDDYDWQATFQYAGGAGGCGDGTPTLEPAVPGSSVSLAPFGRGDVKRVVAKVDGENDGPDWCCLGELFDGRSFAVRAGCDYTGWG